MTALAVERTTSPAPTLTELLDAMPDRIYYCSDEEGFDKKAYLQPTGATSIEIYWDKDAGNAAVGRFSNPSDMTAEQLMRYGMMVSESGSVMALFEQVHRIAHLHPARFGLVPHQHQPLGRMDYRSPEGASPLAGLVPDVVLPAAVDHRFIGTGWFHPDADPSVFGTVYLVPVFVSSPSPHGRRIGVPGWRVRTVGMSADGQFVQWDDVAGIEAVVRRTAEDPEIVATEHVLMDSASAAQDLQRHNRRVQVLAARDSFSVKRNQVRPRLTQDAVEKAVHEYRRSGENGWSNVVSSRHDLSPFDVVGYSRDGGNLWAGWTLSVNRSRARWTEGRSVTPEETVTQEEARDQFAQFLIAQVAERSLGKVAIVEGDTSGGARIVLAQRPDLIEQYPLAFGLPEGVTLRVLN